MPRLERDSKRNETEAETAEVAAGWERRRATDSSFLKEEDNPTNHEELEESETETEQYEMIDTNRPLDFGRFAHEAYQTEAYHRFDDVDLEYRVDIEDPEYPGTYKRDGGRIDLVVNGNKLFDFKTNDMRDWSDSEARRYGNEHGQQMRRYIDSPDAPHDAEGWIVSTVPPESESARAAYRSAVDSYGIDVQFSNGEQPADVIDSIAEVVEDEEEDAA